MSSEPAMGGLLRDLAPQVLGAPDFNDGYTASSGPGLHRADRTMEAIRLTRLLHRPLPGEGEVAGLLALMLRTEARRAARAEPRRGRSCRWPSSDATCGTRPRWPQGRRCPVAGLALLGTLDADGRMATPTASKPSARTCSNKPATRTPACECYLRAAQMTASLPEQRYLTRRAALLPKLPAATDPAGS